MREKLYKPGEIAHMVADADPTRNQAQAVALMRKFERQEILHPAARANERGDALYTMDAAPLALVLFRLRDQGASPELLAGLSLMLAEYMPAVMSDIDALGVRPDGPTLAVLHFRRARDGDRITAFVVEGLSRQKPQKVSIPAGYELEGSWVLHLGPVLRPLRKRRES